MAQATLPTIEDLRNALTYCPETGILTWRERPREMFQSTQSWKTWNARFASRPAGGARWSGASAESARSDGHLRVRIFGRSHESHRVCWAIHHGEWPLDQIDHIDGNPSNNRASNLRVASQSENMRNRKTPRTNTSGVIGVSWHKASLKWRATIMVSGIRLSLGYFERLEDAAASRKAAEIEHGYHSNHGRPALEVRA